MRTMIRPQFAVVARPTAVPSAIPALPRNLQIRVLGEQECTVTAEPLKLVGRRLIVKLSATLSAGACIRIDLPDSFMLGEVLGCWHDRTVFGAIEIEHQVTGLREMEASGGWSIQTEPYAIARPA